MDTLNNETSELLYKQLANIIRNDIFEGRFKQDERIPSEFDLSHIYKISRSTVRKAISLLSEEGLLVKIHGKGTFVASPKFKNSSSTFLSFTENVDAMGKSLITNTISRYYETATPDQKRFFQLDGAEELLKIIRLRSIEALPICVETTWFTKDYDSLLTKNLNGSLYSVLRKDYEIEPSAASKTIELCYASAQEAELLDVPRGSALMLVEDYVYDSYNNPLHITKQVVRGDKFKYALK